jgi:hypothetical protein
MRVVPTFNGQAMFPVDSPLGMASRISLSFLTSNISRTSFRDATRSEMDVAVTLTKPVIKTPLAMIGR